MGQIALPISLAGMSGRIILGPSNQPVADAFGRHADWPFRTAILTGPPRSGKSLLARWFGDSGKGEAIDDADLHDEAALFHRWNRAQEAGTALLLVSAAPPGAWRIALPDLASRLGAALLLAIGPPDDGMLAALVEEHAARRGLVLGAGATAWLLPRLERSHAAVEALVETIDRLSLERKQPVTISLLRDALADNGGAYQPRLL